MNTAHRLLAEIRALDELGARDFGHLSVAVREWRKEGYPVPETDATSKHRWAPVPTEPRDARGVRFDCQCGRLGTSVEIGDVPMGWAQVHIEQCTDGVRRDTLAIVCGTCVARVRAALPPPDLDTVMAGLTRAVRALDPEDRQVLLSLLSETPPAPPQTPHIGGPKRSTMPRCSRGSRSCWSVSRLVGLSTS